MNAILVSKFRLKKKNRETCSFYITLFCGLHQGIQITKEAHNEFEKYGKGRWHPKLFHSSGCIFSHSSRIDWKRTVDKYLSPKLGNMTCREGKKGQTKAKIEEKHVNAQKNAYLVLKGYSYFVIFPFFSFDFSCIEIFFSN